MSFQMQSWSSSDAKWTPMEDLPPKAVWRPRRTVIEAARKCLEWTGLIGIPAMQVVDLETGEVVWRDSSRYPKAGEPIVPEWDATVRADVRHAFASDAEGLDVAEPAGDLALFDSWGAQ